MNKALYHRGVIAAEGIRGRKLWWLRRVARCEARARLLDPQFAEAGYPRGYTSAEHWVDSFLVDDHAVLLSDATLRLHLDAGRGGRFQAEADLRKRFTAYRWFTAGLRATSYFLGRPWEWSALMLRLG